MRYNWHRVNEYWTFQGFIKTCCCLGLVNKTTYMSSVALFVATAPILMAIWCSRAIYYLP